MKVCIAEKPSVAREIANVVGANSRKDGYFEGNGYAVTWTFGHFCTLYTPDDYKVEWKRWNLYTLPMLPDKFLTKVMSDKGVKKQFAIIKKLFKTASIVINCGDAGQEGELIQRWVINEAKYKGKVERLWISSLTREAVVAGFNNLRPSKEFDQLYFAGSARAIGDWLLGMNATRLYTLKYGGGKQVLSIGRVQTPTLAMLVNRHKEITNFVTMPFWELETFYRAIKFGCEKGRFQSKKDGQASLDLVIDKPFNIISSTKNKGKEYAYKLFDLTGLQVHCNKAFGFSADQTLKIVQKLYEQKVVTYPRVDTTFLPTDVYPKIKGILSKLSNYKEFIDPIIDKPIRKTKRVFNDKKVTDHHAIIPTGQEMNLSFDHHRVYDAIVRRFIGNFYPECIVNKTMVMGESEGIRFKASGKQIVDPGWKVLFPKKKKESEDSSEDDEEKELPLFVAGESGPHQPSLREKQTQPPKYYTEATLLRAMETAGKFVENEELKDLMKENGIGRPSTRANIIETLFRRKYAFRKKKLVMASDLGIQLIDTIENPLLKSAELTGQWEQKLRLIESGEYKTGKFIHEMKLMTSNLVNEVRNSQAVSKIDVSNISAKPQFKKRKSTKGKTSKSSSHITSSSKAKSLTKCTCPKCKRGWIIKGKNAYGCSQWEAGCTFRLPFVFKEKSISENQLIRLVQKGSTVTLKGFTIDGAKKKGTVEFNDQHEMIFKADQAKVVRTQIKNSIGKRNDKDVLLCPKCKIGKVIKGKSAYGCSGWKSGCDFKFPFLELKRQSNGQKLTKELVTSLLTKGY